MNTEEFERNIVKANLLKFAYVVALLVQSTGLSGCSAPSPGEPSSPKVVQQAPTLSKYENEQQWIVDSIGRDIAEMLVFAKYHGDSSVQQTPDSLNFKTTTVDAKLNKYKFEVTLPKTNDALTYEFALDRYAWSPVTFQPFAQKLISALKLKPNTTSPTPDNFLKILSDADMPELYKENERISVALSKTPLDASLHEQAALVQAMFDMLELAGRFSDTRAPLNRICAHLAISQSLTPNGELDLVGKIADIALESMSCRDAIAVIKNDALAKSQTNPTVKSWLRALKIRSTGDYRLFDEKNQTPLEASQFGMRYAGGQSAQKMVDYIVKHKCVPQLRWMRITMSGGSSVSVGHGVDAQIFPVELKAVAEDYKAFNNDTIKSQKHCMDELNKTSTRCLQSINGAPRLIPLSWGDIAASHARHVVWAADREYRFNDYMYASDEDAAETLKRGERLLAGLNFLPLIYTDVLVDEKHAEVNKRYFEGIEKLVAEHPENIPPFAWMHARDVGQAGKPPHTVLPMPESWYSPPLPVGTAYYFGHRIHLRNLKPDIAELTQLRSLCPMYEDLCTQWAVKKFGKFPTGDQYREAFGAQVDFNSHVMRKVATGDFDNPVKYESQMEKLAAIAPYEYSALGEYCVRHNEPEKAVRFFQLGLDKEEDAVHSSNNSSWLVMYYYDHNQKQKALEIAKGAAAVYSESGLHCLGQLYERMGEAQKAEQVYKDANERYHNDDMLPGFYLRNKGKDKKYAEKADALIKDAFPAGIQKIDITQLKAPPAVGLRIKEIGPMTAFLGLNNGDIVVALNDFKTDDAKQYHVIRQMATNSTMKLTYWNGQKYDERSFQTVKYNRIGFNFDEYPKKPEKSVN